MLSYIPVLLRKPKIPKVLSYITTQEYSFVIVHFIKWQSLSLLCIRPTINNYVKQTKPEQTLCNKSIILYDDYKKLQIIKA